MNLEDFKARAILQFIGCSFFTFLIVVSVVSCFNEMSLDSILIIIFFAIFAIGFYTCAKDNYKTYKELCDLRDKDINKYNDRMLQIIKEKAEQKRKEEQSKRIVEMQVNISPL